MKMRNVVLGSLLVAAVALSFTQSCVKDDEGSISSTDLSLAQDETYADALFDEVDNLVSTELSNLEENGYSTSTLKSASDACYTVSVDHPDSMHFPKKVYLDFGEGCTVVFKNDTIIRKGQIIITLTDRWIKTGAQHIVAFNDFFINGVKIEGKKTTTNQGVNDQRHLRYHVVLEGGKIIFNDSTEMTRESDHFREVIRRFNPQNDTILVSGTASGTNVLGETYSRTITDPMILVRCSDYNGRWVVAGGIVEITNSNRGVTTIDYTGSGCTGTVIISKNGNKHNYTFKYNRRKNG